MSIICTEIQCTEQLKRSALHCIKKFVHANIDLKTRADLPFPSDYKFLPCFLPKKYEQLCSRIQNFKVRPDDIWIVTFPKSGTTWVYNTVHLMKNKLDFSLEFVPPTYSCLERTIIYENPDNNADLECIINETDKVIDNLDEETSTRVIKSHLPAHLLPNQVWTVKPKVIYVYRNVKDVAISMYHYFQSHKYIQMRGSIEDHFENFLNGYVLFGSHYAHLNSFLQLQQFENILFIKYEDMMSDSIKETKRINDFLNYSYSDQQLMQLSEHCSFENMRNKTEGTLSTNFFRKGKACAYQDEMSPEYIQRFDQMESKTAQTMSI